MGDGVDGNPYSFLSGLGVLIELLLFLVCGPSIYCFVHSATVWQFVLASSLSRYNYFYGCSVHHIISVAQDIGYEGHNFSIGYITAPIHGLWSFYCFVQFATVWQFFLASSLSSYNYDYGCFVHHTISVAHDIG